MPDLKVTSSVRPLNGEPCCYCKASGTIHDDDEFHLFMQMLAKEGARHKAHNMIVDETGLVKKLSLNQILEAMSRPYGAPETREDRNVAVILDEQNHLVDNHINHIFDWSGLNGRSFSNLADAEAWMAEQIAKERVNE